MKLSNVRHFLLRKFIFFVFSLLISGNLIAQNGHTTKVVNGAWEDQIVWHFDQYNPPNYDGNLTGQAYTINGNITRNGNISTGTGITINGNLIVTGSVVNGGGSLTVKNGGILTVFGDFNITSNVRIEDGGTLIVYGNMNITGGSVNMSGNVIVRGDFYINNSGTTVSSSGNLVIGGDFNFAGGGFNVNNPSQSLYILDPSASVSTPPWGNDICDASRTNCEYGNASDLTQNETSPLTDILTQVFGCLWNYPSDFNSCEGGNASFYAQASAGCTYQWQISTNNGVTWTNVLSSAPFSGMTSSKLSVAPVTISMNNYQFRCLVSGGPCSGVLTSKVALLKVFSPPVITTQPVSVSPCSRDNAQSFSVAASGTGLTYQWQYSTNGSTWNNASTWQYSNSTSNTLNIAAWGVNDNTFYRCIVTSNNGCSTTSNIVTLAIKKPSDAGTITGSPTVCRGQSGVVYSVPLISGATSYTWAYSGTGAVIHGTSNSVTVDFSSTATGGNLTVQGLNSCGTGAKSTNFGIITNSAPLITSQPSNLNLSAGTNASFSVVASGTGLTYQWRKNGINITGATSSVLNITNISGSDVGSYDVIVSNGSCSVVSATATLTVITLTAPTSASSDRNNYCVDEGGNITLTATGGSGTTLRWYSGSCGGVLVGSGTPLVLAAPSYTTSYYARWESGSNNSSCATVTVTVLPLPVTGELYRKPNN